MRTPTVLLITAGLTLACDGVESSEAGQPLIALCIDDRASAPPGAWFCGEERVVECSAPGGTAGPTLYVVDASCGGELTPSLRGPFPVGTQVIDVRDGTVAIPPQPARQLCSATLTVVDTTPPRITDRASSIWPPNHRMHSFAVADCAQVVDACDPQLHVTFTYVEVDEPANAQGDGNTAADVVLDCDDVQVRGERQGGGDGRVYTLGVRATDADGNVADGTCTIGISHDRGGQPRAVGSAPSYRVDAPARCTAPSQP